MEEADEVQEANLDVMSKRELIETEFFEKILSKPPINQEILKIVNMQDVFVLLKENGILKRRIIELIKLLKHVRNGMKSLKQRYQSIKMKMDKQSKPRHYKAVKGDLVDELFADYINRLNCPVPITRLGNNQYTFGTRKIYAKVVNGKLVIRVGGGYMDIEEFMRYYGEQELTRLQKLEGLTGDDEVINILDDNQMLMKTEADEHHMSRLEQNVSGRKSMDLGDINSIKQRLREQSAHKARPPSPFLDKAKARFAEENKEKREDGRTQVVGLGEVRHALKQNIVEIKTFHENVQVGHSVVDQTQGRIKTAKKVDPKALQVEK